jgi:NADH-quinone oxidoreductase subunit M
VTQLLLLILIPVVFALWVAVSRPERARTIALAGTLVPVAWFAVIASGFNWAGSSGDQISGQMDWMPSLGVSLSLGADIVSMLLVGLTVLLGPICVLASYTAITERLKTYYGWLLVLQGAMTGVFFARDAILFFIFFEFTLVPMFILISLYGSTNRKAAAIKFFLYTFTGSIIMLAGLVYVAWYHQAVYKPDAGWDFSFFALTNAAQHMPRATQAWVFGALMLGFAIKVPVFPLHTWLPLAHTEAPTAGSVILAGVLLKLGTYGMYRLVLGMVPAAAIEYAPLVGVLAVIGILYAGLICWVQTDVKKLVAYSSVSHLGFCVLGLFAMNPIGLSGSVLYMINHGLSTGALFLLIGMIYERYHTRSMKELGGLASRMPIWATFMVFFTMASVGLPGLNGFIGEFMCLLGAFQADSAWAGQGTVAGTGGELGPWLAFAAGAGMIVTAIYLLYMLGRIVWGKAIEPGHHDHAHGDGHEAAASHAGGHGVLPRDLTAREIGVLVPLAALCLVLGLYPRPVLRALEAPTAVLAGEIAQHRNQPEADEPESAAGEHAAAMSQFPASLLASPESHR